VSDEDLVRLVPARLLRYLSQIPPTPLLAPSPLPQIAVTYYTMAGCWSLDLALQEATGLPIELSYRDDGSPRHAYVVDGDDALDARGPLRRRRACGRRARKCSTRRTTRRR
jgi:hypothetical protein